MRPLSALTAAVAVALAIACALAPRCFPPSARSPQLRRLAAVPELDARLIGHARLQSALETAQHTATPLALRAIDAYIPPTLRIADLADACPDVEVLTALTSNIEASRAAVYHTLPFGEFAERVLARAPSAGYLAEDASLLDACPAAASATAALLAGLPVRAGLFPDALLWIGPQGSFTGLHADVDPLNVLVVVEGSKTVTLFAPSSEPALGPSQRYEYGAKVSDLDPRAPDVHVRFPAYRAATARALNVTLGPGDALFVPHGWWHFVATTQPSLAVSARYETLAQSLALAPAALAKVWHDAVGHALPFGRECTCHLHPLSPHDPEVDQDGA